MIVATKCLSTVLRLLLQPWSVKIKKGFVRSGVESGLILARMFVGIDVKMVASVALSLKRPQAHLPSCKHSFCMLSAL